MVNYLLLKCPVLLDQNIHAGIEELNSSLQTLWSNTNTEHGALLEKLKKITSDQIELLQIPDSLNKLIQKNL